MYEGRATRPRRRSQPDPMGLNWQNGLRGHLYSSSSSSKTRSPGTRKKDAFRVYQDHTPGAATTPRKAYRLVERGDGTHVEGWGLVPQYDDPAPEYQHGTDDGLYQQIEPASDRMPGQYDTGGWACVTQPQRGGGGERSRSASRSPRLLREISQNVAALKRVAEGRSPASRGPSRSSDGGASSALLADQLHNLRRNEAKQDFQMTQLRLAMRGLSANVKAAPCAEPPAARPKAGDGGGWLKPAHNAPAARKQRPRLRRPAKFAGADESDASSSESIRDDQLAAISKEIGTLLHSSRRELSRRQRRRGSTGRGKARSSSRDTCSKCTNCGTPVRTRRPSARAKRRSESAPTTQAEARFARKLVSPPLPQEDVVDQRPSTRQWGSSSLINRHPPPRAYTSVPQPLSVYSYAPQSVVMPVVNADSMPQPQYSQPSSAMPSIGLRREGSSSTPPPGTMPRRRSIVNPHLSSNAAPPPSVAALPLQYPENAFNERGISGGSSAGATEHMWTGSLPSQPQREPAEDTAAGGDEPAWLRQGSSKPPRTAQQPQSVQPAARNTPALDPRPMPARAPSASNCPKPYPSIPAPDYPHSTVAFGATGGTSNMGGQSPPPFASAGARTGSASPASAAGSVKPPPCRTTGTQPRLPPPPWETMGTPSPVPNRNRAPHAVPSHVNGVGSYAQPGPVEVGAAHSIHDLQHELSKVNRMRDLESPPRRKKQPPFPPKGGDAYRAPASVPFTGTFSRPQRDDPVDNMKPTLMPF
eukprot:gene8887-13776_t